MRHATPTRTKSKQINELIMFFFLLQSMISWLLCVAIYSSFWPFLRRKLKHGAPAQRLRSGSHACMCWTPQQPSNVRASSEMWGTGFLPGNHMLAATPSIWLASPVPNFRVISRVPTGQDRVAWLLAPSTNACVQPNKI